jgi:hypothetical protein
MMLLLSVALSIAEPHFVLEEKNLLAFDSK